MDNRGRNPDRADPLRALPQSLARGALQVLQPPPQYEPRRLDGEAATGIRESGSANGNLTGLTCTWCGKPLTNCTIRREFCGRKCRQSYYTAQEREERIEARQGRKCLWCNGPIPAESRGDVIYCSKTCQSKAQADMAKVRRTCQQCGKTFRGHGELFCSHACYADSRRKRHPKQCPVCQVTFKPHRAEQVCCSQACRYEQDRRQKAVPYPAPVPPVFPKQHKREKPPARLAHKSLVNQEFLAPAVGIEPTTN